MKKLIKFVLTIVIFVVILLTALYAEYRFIMENLCPYIGEDNKVYIEFYGQIDEYSAGDAEELFAAWEEI